MNELSRSLIAAAREGLAPDAAVAARVRAKVAATVGATAATGSAAAISVKGGSTTLLLKLGAALVAIGVVTGLVISQRDRKPPEAPRAPIAAPADDVRSDDVRVVAPADLSNPSNPAQPSDPSRQSPAKHPAGSSQQHGAPAAAPASDDATAPDEPTQTTDLTGETAATGSRRGSRTPGADDEDGVSLAREVELIDLATVSLHKRAPHAALEAIKAYERETRGRGQLAQEAAAIEIEARCNMNLDATKQIERFDQKYPESAQRERIQTACFSNK
jgi:hypothetical protein